MRKMKCKKTFDPEKMRSRNLEGDGGGGGGVKAIWRNLDLTGFSLMKNSSFNFNSPTNRLHIPPFVKSTLLYNKNV